MFLPVWHLSEPEKPISPDKPRVINPEGTGEKRREDHGACFNRMLVLLSGDVIKTA